MSGRRWSACVGFILLMALLAPGLAAQAPAEEERAPLDGGRVVLDWNTFREITKQERVEDGKEPKLILPWKEVQDLLGVQVEGAEGAELELDWRQFKALLQWSVERKKPEPEPAFPADYVIATADYAGVLRKEGAVFEVALAVDVLKEKGWKRVPLLPATVALESAELPQDCFLNVLGGRYELLVPERKGRIEVKMKFAAAVTEKAGASQVGFDGLPSGTTVLKLTVPYEKARVDVAGAQAVLPLQGEQGATVVGASLPSGAPVRITWERALEEIEKVPARLYAETSTLVAVGEGILTCRERLSLSVLHTGIREVSLSVPTGVSVLEVTGDAVHDWRATDDVLDVRFARDVLGTSQLSLIFELPGVQAEKTQVPVVRVPAAVREKGYIAIVAVANVEISAPDRLGATSIDVRELPADLLHMTSQPVLLAFRYVGKDLGIALVVKKHADVEVLLTIADSALVTVMQTSDGRRITKAIYNVRNNRSQFIRVELPRDKKAAPADVWSATVAGKSVRPALDEQGRVLIPLVRSGGRAELSAFPVELVYVEKQEGVGESGQMQVTLPRVNVPLTHLMVQLYLPAEGGYTTGLLGKLSFEGPLRLVKEFSRIASAGAAPPELAQPDAQAQALQQEYQARVEAEAVAAGVTPIRVELPTRGQLFRFEKILVLDEPLWVSFRYDDWGD